MKKFIITASILLFSNAVFANNTVFQCFTHKGKQILVTQKGNHYQYRFGLPNKPEIVFSNKISDVMKRENTNHFRPMNDYGVREDVASMDLRNGSYSYQIYVTGNGGGVEVYKSAKRLSDVKCNLHSYPFEIYSLIQEINKYQ
jgi:hypothetical protein